VLVRIWKTNNNNKRRIPTHLLENILTLVIKELKISVEQGTVVKTLNLNKHYLSYLVYGQRKVHVACIIEHVQIKSLIFYKYCCEKICKPHLRHILYITRSEDKWSPREHKRMIKLDFFFKTALFAHVLKKRKKSTHSLFGAWSSFLVHTQFTPSEEPKAFKSTF
jgi:hypothetical protein